MADTYEPIEKCIYCGKTEEESKLNREHIIPYSLGGHAFLPKASCQECEAITSAFEGRCANTMFKILRIRLNIQSRRKKKKIKSMPVVALVDGKTITIEMPIDGLLGTIPIIQFQPPGFLRNPVEKPQTFAGTTLSMKTIRPKDLSIWEELGVADIGTQMTFQVESYALLIAKIAHCAAIGEFGVNNFDHLLPQYIINQNSDGLHYLVGGIAENEVSSLSSNMHYIKSEVFKHGKEFYVSVKIQLFANLGGIITQVIAGLTDVSRIEAIKSHLKERGKL